jgi:N-formylglutamate deformylase
MVVVPYNLLYPEIQSTSVIFCSPHSGRYYPEEFIKMSVLDERTIRSSEDAFVDKLVSQVIDFGALFLKALLPRAYVDLNRNVNELDPALIEGVRSQQINSRVSSGLGIIPRVVGGGKEIYKGKISTLEAEMRIENFWKPYHHVLRDTLINTRTQFGEAILIDCHSMPSGQKLNKITGQSNLPDIVLGDGHGASCKEVIIDAVESEFLRAGFTVSRNVPFSGAFIVKQYGFPKKNENVIQLEICRSLYMDEENVCLNKNFAEFRDVLGEVLKNIAHIGKKEPSVAAE